MRYSDDDDNRYDRYADDDDPRDRRPRRRKRRRHSELGIASCALAVIAGAVVFLTVVVAGVIGAREGDLNENDPRAMAVGCVMVTGGGLAFIGVILGIVGVLQERRKKLFAGLGLGFNACIVLGVVTVTILGMLVIGLGDEAGHIAQFSTAYLATAPNPRFLARPKDHWISRPRLPPWATSGKILTGLFNRRRFSRRVTFDE